MEILPVAPVIERPGSPSRVPSPIVSPFKAATNDNFVFALAVMMRGPSFARPDPIALCIVVYDEAGVELQSYHVGIRMLRGMDYDKDTRYTMTHTPAQREVLDWILENGKTVAQMVSDVSGLIAEYRARGRVIWVYSFDDMRVLHSMFEAVNKGLGGVLREDPLGKRMVAYSIQYVITVCCGKCGGVDAQGKKHFPSVNEVADRMGYKFDPEVAYSAEMTARIRGRAFQAAQKMLRQAAREADALTEAVETGGHLE